jgi:hypothetical protein
MNVKIAKSLVERALGTLAKIQEHYNSMPVFDHVLIRAGENELQLACVSPSRAMRAIYPAEVGEPGETSVDVKTDYKSRYRMTIWDQFQSEIRSAAYTGSLARFINSICSRMGIDPGRNESERQVIEEIVQSADDRVALKMLREETTLLVLMVR